MARNSEGEPIGQRRESSVLPAENKAQFSRHLKLVMDEQKMKKKQIINKISARRFTTDIMVTNVEEDRDMILASKTVTATASSRYDEESKNDMNIVELKNEDTYFSTINGDGNGDRPQRIGTLENSAVTISPAMPSLVTRPVISPLASQPFVQVAVNDEVLT